VYARPVFTGLGRFGEEVVNATKVANQFGNLATLGNLARRRKSLLQTD